MTPFGPCDFLLADGAFPYLLYLGIGEEPVCAIDCNDQEQKSEKYVMMLMDASV